MEEERLGEEVDGGGGKEVEKGKGEGRSGEEREPGGGETEEVEERREGCVCSYIPPGSHLLLAALHVVPLDPRHAHTELRDGCSLRRTKQTGYDQVSQGTKL